MMWPKITNELDGIFLAASHSIGINAYDEIETALILSDTLKERYPELLITYYAFKTPIPSDEEFLEHIAKARNFIIKGGKANLLKAAVTFINDYRNGGIGKITLESPSSRKIMLENSAISTK
jgi:ribosome biogenesis GTPase A